MQSNIRRRAFMTTLAMLGVPLFAIARHGNGDTQKDKDREKEKEKNKEEKEEKKTTTRPSMAPGPTTARIGVRIDAATRSRRSRRTGVHA